MCRVCMRAAIAAMLASVALLSAGALLAVLSLTGTPLAAITAILLMTVVVAVAEYRRWLAIAVFIPFSVAAALAGGEPLARWALLLQAAGWALWSVACEYSYSSLLELGRRLLDDLERCTSALKTLRGREERG